MRTQASPDLAQVLVEAEDIALNAGQSCSSVHVLLALFTVPNRAQVLLRDRGVSEDGVLERISRVEREDDGVIDGLVLKARTLAWQADMTEFECLHLLVAILRSRDVAAHRLLRQAGIDLVKLRTQAMSYLTGSMPRRVREAVLATTEAEEAVHNRSGPASTAQSAPYEARPKAKPPAAPGAPPPRPDGRDLERDESAERPEKGTSNATPEPSSSSRPGDSSTAEPATKESLGHAPEPTEGRTNPERGTSDRAPSRPPDPEAEEPRGSAAAPRTPCSRELLSLEPEQYPWLSALGRNLTLLAFEGRLDPLIGRAREVDEIIDVLGKRRANNPVLVGEPGVGKTAIVEGLAQALLALRRAGSRLGERIIIEIDMASVLAGTHLRGSFSEKLNGIKDEVRKAGGRVVVFVDEIHTIVGAGATGEGPQDAANELKAALARGEFPCVGATTHDEYRRFIEQDPALERRFSPVLVGEPGLDATRLILAGLIDRYSEHHGVSYTDDALRAAVSLSARYITDRCLPDKAIAIIDLAGSRAAREGSCEVDAADIARVVSKTAKVPEERLLMTDRERFLRMEERLAERIVGHQAALSRIAQAIRRNYAGFDGHRPMGSFLLLGPTGVGKTETAKVLADTLFGSPDALVRFDMSEFGEANTASRLIGAPPGYVGYGDGGQLTEALRRRPFAVVLLDELEKAHRDVLQLLLQVLEEGHLTDGRGRKVTFANTVVLMTSNLGSEVFANRASSRVGFRAGIGPEEEHSTDRGERAERVLEQARAALSPELWNRIDDRLVFEPLTRDQVASIATLLLTASSAAIFSEKQIAFEATGEAIQYLIDNGGYDLAFGARPLRRAIQRMIEAPIAELILSGEIPPGTDLIVSAGPTGLLFEQRGEASGAA